VFEDVKRSIKVNHWRAWRWRIGPSFVYGAFNGAEIDVSMGVDTTHPSKEIAYGEVENQERRSEKIGSPAR
jgi:hypothetical protein